MSTSQTTTSGGFLDVIFDSASSAETEKSGTMASRPRRRRYADSAYWSSSTNRTAGMARGKVPLDLGWLDAGRLESEAGDEVEGLETAPGGDVEVVKEAEPRT